MAWVLAEECMKALEQDIKIAFLVTRNADGEPHITFISSLQAKNEKELIWAQNSSGESKKNVLAHPETAFIVLNLNMELWRGKATWNRCATNGPELEMYNSKTVNKYNTYGANGKVHYMDLVEVSEKEKLNMKSIIFGALLTRFSAGAVREKSSERVLRPYGEKLIQQLKSLKFLAYIGSDGFPVIIPVIQATAADSGRIVFSAKPYENDLLNIPEGTRAAVFTVSMSFDEVLVKGVFKGFRRIRGIYTGVMDIDRVYNPMPPKPCYIYPQAPLVAVTEF